MRILAAALLVALLYGTSAASPASDQAGGPRFELLAHADPGGFYTADVFGHRGHAYLSSERGGSACPSQGVRVYDVRNPRRPQLVSRFADGRSEPSLSGTWTEKTIVRDVATPVFRGVLAVTSVQACRRAGFTGFALYDVTDPARPRALSLFRAEPNGSHEIWLQPKGDRAYVYLAIPGSELESAPDFGRRRGRARIPGAPDFRIVDVTDPARPVQVGEWGAWKRLRIRPNRRVGRRTRIGVVHSVITNAAATRAFLSYWDLGTVILDITQPSRPRYLGRTRFRRDEPGAAHSAALGRGERLLIETHETTGGTVTLFDVSRPSRPRRLSRLALPKRVLEQGRRRNGFGRARSRGLSDSVHDPDVQGRLAFFSWYGQGVIAADVSNPRRPRFLARFLPRRKRDPERLLCPRRRCTAVWGVHATPEYVLASDMLSGLWVLRLRQ